MIATIIPSANASKISLQSILTGNYQVRICGLGTYIVEGTVAKWRVWQAVANAYEKMSGRVLQVNEVSAEKHIKVIGFDPEQNQVLVRVNP